MDLGGHSLAHNNGFKFIQQNNGLEHPARAWPRLDATLCCFHCFSQLSLPLQLGINSQHGTSLDGRQALQSFGVSPLLPLGSS